jgi:RimJ/RimL family protein N-acetyltransferase
MSTHRTILETTRLVLREMTLGDLDFVAAMLAHPEVMRYWPRCQTREEAEGWIRRQLDRYTEHGFGYWLALAKDSGAPVGQLGVLPNRPPGVPELDVGYIIHRPYWRKGFACEGAAACRDHAFFALHQSRVVCTIRPENIPSLGVARKAGFRPDGRRTELAGLEHVVFVAERPSHR